MRFKDLYDQDKDGRLNREEQLRWVAPNSYGSAREEVSFTRDGGNSLIFWILMNNPNLQKLIPILKDQHNHLFSSALVSNHFSKTKDTLKDVVKLQEVPLPPPGGGS